MVTDDSNMEGTPLQLGREVSRPWEVLVLPVNAVSTAGENRNEVIGELRNSIRPLVLRGVASAENINNAVEQTIGNLCRTLSLERVKTSVMLVDGQETVEEARMRRVDISTFILSAKKPWGFLTGNEEMSDEGFYMLPVRLLEEEVSVFQCLLMLTHLHVFLRKILHDGLQPCSDLFFDAVNAMKDMLDGLVGGVLQHFLKGGRDDIVYMG